MRKLLFLLIFLGWTTSGLCASRTPINEYSTQVTNAQGKSYTEIGGGINYQKDDGSFAEASAQFISSRRTGIDWECYTTHNRIGLKNDISSGAYSVFSQIGNSGQILRSKPVALAYLNTETKEWTIISNIQSSTASVSGNKILYKDAFKNCDIEYVIQKDRLKQNVYIKSIDGFSKSPYDADKTQVVVVTKFDLDNFETPSIVDARGSVSLVSMKLASATAKNTGDETLDGEIKFSKQTFGMCEATDAKGDSQKIRKRIIKHDGNYYLLEGLPYSWLASASYPVLLDYTTKSSAFGTETWSGTIYVSTSISQNQNSLLTVDAGTVIKLASGVNLSVNGIDINGTSASWVYVTSKNDNTVGETIDGSSGSPAAGDYGGLNVIYWNNVGNSSFNIDNTVIRYATTGWYVYCYTAITNTLNDVIIKNCSSGGINFQDPQGGGTRTIVINDFQIDTCVTGYFQNRTGNSTTLKRGLIRGNTSVGIGGSYHGSVTGRNLTIDGNGTGIYLHLGSSTDTYYDCIISNNTTNLTNDQTLNFNYCMQYNNGTTNNPSANNNPLTPANPNFATGTAVSGYIGDMTYFLNQSTSPCKDAGSDTAANLSLNTYTTATDNTTDSGTVDIGYHYEPNDVATAAGSTIQNIRNSIGNGICNGLNSGMR